MREFTGTEAIMSGRKPIAWVWYETPPPGMKAYHFQVCMGTEKPVEKQWPERYTYIPLHADPADAAVVLRDFEWKLS